MGEPAILIPTDHLTRKLLLKAVGGSNPLLALLEPLCTDSLYVIKDDFDDAIDPSRWQSVRSALDGRDPFYWEEDITGWAVGDPGGRDDAHVRLFSTTPRWSARRRCSVMGRFDLSNKANVKFEFGFVTGRLALDDPSVSGAVNVKATPTGNQSMGDFSVAVLDRDDNTACDLVTQRSSTVTAADQAGGPTLTSLTTPFTVLVSLTEDGSAGLWLNGVLIARLQATPRSVGAFHGTSGSVTEAGLARESSLMSDPSGMYIWAMVQNRSTGALNRALRIDYIQAWQERAAVE